MTGPTFEIGDRVRSSGHPDLGVLTICGYIYYLSSMMYIGVNDDGVEKDLNRYYLEKIDEK